MDAAIGAVDHGIGRARQLVMKAALDQAPDHGIARRCGMERKAADIDRAIVAHRTVHGLDDVCADRKIAQRRFRARPDRPSTRTLRVSEAEAFELLRPSDQQAPSVGIIARRGTQIDDAGGLVSEVFELPVKTGPAIGADIAFECRADLALGAAAVAASG